jgi:hypothetical protein
MPVGPFVEHLSSGRWTDRNKAASLLERLSRSRDPDFLGRLRSDAIPALYEMARWRWAGHSSTSRLILGRIAGIEESSLNEMVANEKFEAIVEAISSRK